MFKKSFIFVSLFILSVSFLAFPVSASSSMFYHQGGEPIYLTNIEEPKEGWHFLTLYRQDGEDEYLEVFYFNFNTLTFNSSTGEFKPFNASNPRYIYYIDAKLLIDGERKWRRQSTHSEGSFTSARTSSSVIGWDRINSLTYSTDCVFYDPNGIKIFDPGLPFNIFTVNPAISLSGLVDNSNIDHFDVTVSLTPEFLACDYGNNHTVDLVCYISRSSPSNFSSSYSNTAYQYLSSGEYLASYNDEINSPTLGKSISGEGSLYVIAGGLKPGFVLSDSQTSQTLRINFNEIDVQNASELYLCVYGAVRQVDDISVANGNTLDQFANPFALSDSYRQISSLFSKGRETDPASDPFNSLLGEYFALHDSGSVWREIFGSLKTIDNVNFSSTDRSGAACPAVQFWYSDSFHFSVAPVYTGMLNSQGTKIADTNHSVDDFLNADSPNYIKPEAYSFSDDKDLKLYLPEDAKKYVDDWVQRANISEGTDFNAHASDMFKLYDTESGFFKFMSASISILPKNFMTIFITFMFIILGVTVLKFLR